MHSENNRENKSENKETFAEGRRREGCAQDHNQNHSQTFEQKALLYAYGELPAEEEKNFLLHLNGCKICQRVLFVSSAARASLSEVKAPAVCLDKILLRSAQIDAAKDAAAQKRPFAAWLRWVFKGGAGADLRPAPAVRLTSFAAVLAAAMLIFAGVFFYKGGYGGTKGIYAVSVSQQDFLNSMYNNLDSIETEVEGLETYISQFQ